MGYGQYSADGPWNRKAEMGQPDKNPNGKRAKHVCDTSDIPHMWAHPLESDGTGYYQTHARNPQSNLFFKTSEDGTRVLFSYRESYPIGSLFTVRKGKTTRRVYLTFGDKPYSVTTAAHMNCARRAVPRNAIHWDVLRVVSSYSTKPTREAHLINVKFLASEYAATVAKLVKAHSLRTITWELQRAREQRKNALEYAQFFGIKAPKLVPVPTITAEKRAKALAFDASSEERRARIRAARQARWDAQRLEYEKQREQERENARKTLPERIAKWRQGEYVGYFDLDYALLRLSQKDGAPHVQTSQGASVPVCGQAGAARLFRFLKALVDSGREYQRNGHTEHIGAFAVDSFKVEETTWLDSAPQSQYVLTAGCHRIVWSEIESISDAVLAAETKEGQGTPQENALWTGNH